MSTVRRAFHMMLEDPANALARGAGLARAQFWLRGCSLGHGVSAFGRVYVDGAAGITVGNHVSLVGGMLPTALVCHPGAVLSVGDGCVFNYGVSVEAFARVRVGQRCMLGSMVRLCDRTLDGKRLAVTLEDDVWLAHGVIVEPGVTIGAGSVVSAGSVVTRDIPPRCVAAGNPARAMHMELSTPAPDRAV